MSLITTSITYYRSTSFSFEATPTPPDGLTVSSGLFTVKENQYDTDATDATAIIKKSVAAVAGVCEFNIAPGDVADTVEPGAYWYSIHIVLSDGKIYPFASGKFNLKATSTNRES